MLLSAHQDAQHLDVYGTLGELFANDTDKIAAYLADLVETVRPYGFLIESPIIAKTQREQIEQGGLALRLSQARGRELERQIDVLNQQLAESQEQLAFFRKAREGKR